MHSAYAASLLKAGRFFFARSDRRLRFASGRSAPIFDGHRGWKAPVR
jgi:hypothetical protein